MPPGTRAIGRRYQRIDASLFERWLFKTVINLIYCTATDDQWVAPREWVEIVFGLGTFPDRCGLYIEHNDQALVAAGLYFGLLVRTFPGTNTPAAGQIKINGWGMIVTMHPLGGAVDYRPEFLRLEYQERVYRSLRLDWSSTEPRRL